MENPVLTPDVGVQAGILTHPACYATQQDYDDWASLARLAREEASPCTDCEKPYKAKMLRQGRCDAKLVRANFSFTHKKIITIKEAH